MDGDALLTFTADNNTGCIYWFLFARGEKSTMKPNANK